MSVVVIARFAVPDLAKAKRALASNPALLEEITEDAKRLGAQHHRFLEGDGELIVLDEWDDPAAFRKFFEGNPKVARITDAAGVQGPPTVTVYGSVETAGTF